MTVSTEHIKDIFMGDGVNTRFQPTFQVIEKDQLKCLKVLETGEEIEILNTEFEIRLINGGANGAEVAYPLVGNPLEEGNKLIVYRQTEITNNYAPPNGQIFDAAAIKAEVDRLTMQNQEQKEGLSRSVQVSIGSEVAPEEYLDNVNEMLANARELQDSAVIQCEETLSAAQVQANNAALSAKDSEKAKNDAATQVSLAAGQVVLATNEANRAKNEANRAEEASGHSEEYLDNKVTNCILSAPNGVATYSGNVVTLKAGIKFLIPNGKNADGTLNNINFTLTEDVVSEPFLGPYSLFLFYDYDSKVVGSSDVSMYYESDIEPTNKNNGTIWFNLKENKTYIYRSSWEAVKLVKVAIMTVSNGVITKLSPFQPVELLKASDMAMIIGNGKPNYDIRISKPTTGFIVERSGWVVSTLSGVGGGNSSSILVNEYLVAHNDCGGIQRAVVEVSLGDVVTTRKTNTGFIANMDFIPDFGD